MAFSGTLDGSSADGIYTGPDPAGDEVIATGDTLKGATVRDVAFCREGLSDAGEVAFVAKLKDPDTPDRRPTAIFRATPRAETP